MGTPLEALISDRVRSDGPLPFVEFMRLALYHPEHGYYTSRAPGSEGDYTTAPASSPLFGRLIGRFLGRMREAVGRLEVAEIGPGAGDLAAAALGELGAGVRWTCVEPHPRVEALQRERLAGLPVAWTPRLDGPVTGCVLANEVVDNLPVHLVEVRDGRLWEGRVALADPSSPATGPSPAPFALVFDAEPSAQVAAYVERYAGEVTDGQCLEVCLEAGRFVAEAAEALERGYLVVIDYGDEAPRLYERRPEGTLLAYAGTDASADVLRAPGAQDVTAFVNVTSLADGAAEAGLRHVGTTTQRELLLSLGLREELERMRAAAASADGVEELRLHAARSAAAGLARRGGMGDFFVAVWAKDAPDVDLPRPRSAQDLPKPPPI